MVLKEHQKENHHFGGSPQKRHPTNWVSSSEAPPHFVGRGSKLRGSLFWNPLRSGHNPPHPPTASDRAGRIRSVGGGERCGVSKCGRKKKTWCFFVSPSKKSGFPSVPSKQTAKGTEPRERLARCRSTTSGGGAKGCRGGTAVWQCRCGRCAGRKKDKPPPPWPLQ